MFTFVCYGSVTTYNLRTLIAYTSWNEPSGSGGPGREICSTLEHLSRTLIQDDLALVANIINTKLPNVTEALWGLL